VQTATEFFIECANDYGSKPNKQSYLTQYSGGDKMLMIPANGWVANGSHFHSAVQVKLPDEPAGSMYFEDADSGDQICLEWIELQVGSYFFSARPVG
jgi:hypothetical protein